MNKKLTKKRKSRARYPITVDGRKAGYMILTPAMKNALRRIGALP